MVLTSAEGVRKYRGKLKNNPEKAEVRNKNVGIGHLITRFILNNCS